MLIKMDNALYLYLETEPRCTRWISLGSVDSFVVGFGFARLVSHFGRKHLRPKVNLNLLYVKPSVWRLLLCLRQENARLI